MAVFANVDLFAVGRYLAGGDINVFSAYHREETGAWRGWFPLPNWAATSTRPASAGLRAVINGNSIDLFMLSEDGRIYTSFWRPGREWSEWASVGTWPSRDIKARPGPAVLQVGTNIDLFVIGSDGNVYTAYFREDRGWNGWFRVLAFPDGFKAAFEIEAIARNPGEIDLFVLADRESPPERKLFTSWWRPEKRWSDGATFWSPLTSGGLPVGTFFKHTVAAVSSTPDGIDLFAICGGGTGLTGLVYTLYFRADLGWSSEWKPIRDGLLKPGLAGPTRAMSRVTAVSKSQYAIDLCTVS